MSTLISDKIKLYSNCIPVKGAERSIIYDLTRGSYQFIPNSLFELLKKYEGNTITSIKAFYDNKYDDIIDEYVTFLVNNEFVFFTNEPESFPRLNLDWFSSSIISNAIICISKNQNYEFDRVVKQLNQLNCKAVQLRFFDSYSLDELATVLEKFNDSRVTSIEICIKFNSDFDMNAIFEKFQELYRLNKILIYSSPANNIEFFGDEKAFIIERVVNNIKEENICTVIHPSSFVQNIPFFTESLNYNTCLNRKVAIDENGEIKNCPSMKESFGNVKTDDLLEVVKTLEFQKKWRIKKDDIKVCKDCEFRYMCLDCRADLNENEEYNQPKNCHYNPYIAKWKGQDGYISIKDIQNQKIDNTNN